MSNPNQTNRKPWPAKKSNKTSFLIVGILALLIVGYALAKGLS